MSRTRIIKGKLTEIVHGDYNIYSKTNIIDNALQFINEKGVNQGVSHTINPEKAPSINLVSYYIKIRLKNVEKFNGEFGFDWIDINATNGDLEKIQGTAFSEVEYFYKEPVNKDDLGDIVEASSDIDGAKKAILEHYKTEIFTCENGKIDQPYILIKKNQEITISLEVVVPNGEELTDEKIYIEDDNNYIFELLGGTKTDKRTEKIITKNEKIDLKIKCINESGDTSFKILQDSPTQKMAQVGGFTMMENKLLKLKFRVIALVSNDNSPAEKAKALFQKFKDNEITKYLNENSLNQACYEVEIENFAEKTNADIEDYFYAFDKTDWTTKGLYTANHPMEKVTRTISYDMNGNPTETETKQTVNTNVIAYEGEIDAKVLDLYNEKLKVKNSSYIGGVIIIAEYESKSETTGAFSRTFPMDHYSLFVYSNNVENKQTYAHEIGHMLGLEHTFLKNSSDKYDYETKIAIHTRDLINPTVELINKEKKDNKNLAIGKTIKQIASFNESNFYVRRDTLLSAISNSNKYIIAQIKNYKELINDKTNYSSYTWNKEKITRADFLEKCDTMLQKNENYLINNENTTTILRKYNSNNFKNIKEKYHLIAEDELKVYKDHLIKIMTEWEQLKSNYIYFKLNKSQNMMDYTKPKYDVNKDVDIEQCIFFLNHQIKIMRKDYENY